MSGVRLIHEIGTCFTRYPSSSGCRPVSAFTAKPRLSVSRSRGHLAPHDLQVVRQVPNTPPEQQHRQRVKGAVRDDLSERIIQQHAVTGETASDHHVVALGRPVKKVAELRQKMLEVAIYREHPLARSPRADRRRWPGRRRSAASDTLA